MFEGLVAGLRVKGLLSFSTAVAGVPQKWWQHLNYNRLFGVGGNNNTLILHFLSFFCLKHSKNS